MYHQDHDSAIRGQELPAAFLRSAHFRVDRGGAGTPLITLPIVNHDNNQHAANENLQLQNLFDGMQVYAGIIAHLGRVWNDTP